MSLLRALHAETLKMKRTIALKMVVLAPMVIVLLVLFAASQGPFSMVNRFGVENSWTTLARWWPASCRRAVRSGRRHRPDCSRRPMGAGGFWP